MDSSNSQQNSETNFPKEGAEEAEQVVIFTDYSDKSHVLTGPFKVKYEQFRIDNLRPCRQWTFGRKLFSGPGWRIAKDSLKELTDLLEKADIDYRVVAFNQQIRRDGLAASRAKSQAKAQAKRLENRPEKEPKVPKSGKKAKVEKKPKAPKKEKNVPVISSMDDVKMGGLRTERWRIHNLVFETPNDWKGADHLHADNVEKTEFGNDYFFHFNPALSFAEAMDQVRTTVPDEHPINLTYHAKEKLLLVAF
jgi:hypothetical protein